jgi:hypothetical protein
MSQTIERLKDYLLQLPPQAQALLMRKFESAIERGEDTAIATLVLGQLRKVARAAEEDAQPYTGDPSRLAFRALEPFLTDGSSARPGQIRRTSLVPVWRWIAGDGAAEQVRDYEAALSRAGEGKSSPEIEAKLRVLQMAAADAIAGFAGRATGSDPRALSRIGPPDVIEDLLSVGCVLRAREALDGLSGRMPKYLRVFGDAEIAQVAEALNLPVLQTPQVLPFALSMVMQRIANPWQIIRLAIRMAASDDEIRVAATPYGVVVTMVLHDLASRATELRLDIRRGHFANVAENLRALHDGIRGLRGGLDLRQDSTWGRQLAAIRAGTSSALQSEIETIPGRVRRILRQRADKDVPPGTPVNTSDVEEAVALIDFVAVCRTFASELAISEVTLRTYSDLQQYVEKATEALVQSLRSSDAKERTHRQTQLKAAVRFCEVLFGPDYASLVNRAAENALTGERKSARAS